MIRTALVRSWLGMGRRDGTYRHTAGGGGPGVWAACSPIWHAWHSDRPSKCIRVQRLAGRMSDGRKRFALERRVGNVVVIEEGEVGVMDVAVFYSADYDLALAVTDFLNGDLGEAEQLRIEWLARRAAP
jgi:hypothetical protein